MTKDPKDGFDLIEYPVDYAFKAMCKAVEGEPAQDYLVARVEPIIKQTSLLSVKGNASRTGKFESVTLTVRLQSREELESVYKLIASAERVVMTL